ncbi:MAG: hypothetical protein O3A95_10775 [Planctomycetota bacterium]|nr:hypothetical protein [Planctomycetota bacterium]MDA1114766.1 hypothetical protein [Planctomycetota bacterium]
MAEQKINLAAFGSVAFPIAMVVEGPIIMLLAASTALCRDWDSYRKVRRFMYAASAALTLLHILIAFTPLYDVIAGQILGVPDDLLAPGRLGLQILTPWTAAIAYRRFLQGVMIRFGKARLVMLGTGLRLTTLLATLVIMRSTGASGIVVGTTGIAAGVVAEAIFARWAVGPILREQLPATDPTQAKVNRKSFLHFYLPLAMTPLLTLFIGPAGAAAMSRMPNAELSLPAWQVVHAIVFLMRSTGFAFNEVVIAQWDQPGAKRALTRFAFIVAITTSSLLVLIAATPLRDWLLGDIYQLQPDLMAVCATALLFTMFMPAYQAFQSLYQGQLVHKKQTRGITQAVALYVVVALTGLQVSIWWGAFTGIYAAITVFSIGGILQTLWLRRRANLQI